MHSRVKNQGVNDTDSSKETSEKTGSEGDKPLPRKRMRSKFFSDEYEKYYGKMEKSTPYNGRRRCRYDQINLFYLMSMDWIFQENIENSKNLTSSDWENYSKTYNQGWDCKYQEINLADPRVLAVKPIQ